MLICNFVAHGKKECTPDELAVVCRDIQESSKLVRSHIYHLVIYKNSFVGRELVNWLVSSKSMCMFITHTQWMNEMMDG